MENNKIKICVVGLGYVGLPLALALSKHFQVIGFDIDENKIIQYKQGTDPANEVSKEDFFSSPIIFSTNAEDIRESNFIITCVPTPIDDAKKPDLRLVRNATKLIGENLSPGSIVVFESTVYPGVTEEICVPILEKNSGLKLNEGFKVGYSPERINPGDKDKTINKITRVISASDEDSIKILEQVYGSITTTYIAKSIRVAEAAKVIENIQRDINIALANELKMIFDKKDIDIYDVLKAAETKWNFIPFYPGLVGGHCIGVDPYYLAHEASRMGHHPEIILAGRRINDNMAKYEAERIIKRLIDKDLVIKGLRVLILGATFKPNVNDLRNSKVNDLAQELEKYGCKIKIHDSMINSDNVFGFENISLGQAVSEEYNVAILAVRHKVLEEDLIFLRNKFSHFLELHK